MKKKLIVLLTASVVAFGFSFTFAKSAKNVKDAGGATANGWVWND